MKDIFSQVRKTTVITYEMRIPETFVVERPISIEQLRNAIEGINARIENFSVECQNADGTWGQLFTDEEKQKIKIKAAPALSQKEIWLGIEAFAEKVEKKLNGGLQFEIEP